MSLDRAKPAVITGADVSLADQCIRYELATLSFGLTDADRAVAGIRPWLDHPEATGELLGVWHVEHGVLGRLHVLRRFDSAGQLETERQRSRLSGQAFGGRAHLVDLTLRTFAPFPFMPPVQPGHYGSVYEMRDYHLVPGGLPATIAGWRRALPGRHLVDPITVVMYAVDGPDRIVQIWPFDGLDERVAIRAELAGDKRWPPPGGPENIKHGTSEMWWPLDFSPLH